MTTDDRNFRLSRDVLPRRILASLTLDMDARTFAGEADLALSVERAVRSIVLHAVELDVSHVEVHAGGSVQPARVTVRPVSETVVLDVDAEVPAGEARLVLRWTGRFTEGLRGLYLAGSVAATQFEAADARRVFPCFDEPSFKCTWALTVKVPPNLVALGNGRVLAEELEGPHRKVRFAETEVLPSYLVALVVGPLVSTGAETTAGVPVRTWCLEEKRGLLGFGQKTALAVLPMLQDYFGLPYAFGKLDQVGIPDFEAGAMENAGLITYRELALLLDPATAPLAVQKRVAEVITHELAHQWFGNWVTMVWWDDLWLNEAFATWMAYKIVDRWRPDWRVWLDFDAGKATALHLDALRSTHPIRGTVANAAEATESFDAITYEKGGAVLRMIEGFLGEESFRSGIRDYMRRHARANAVADDLWGALARASHAPVVELANAWIRQSGYPVVSVALAGNRVRLSQERFFSEPRLGGPEIWPVPLVLAWGDDRGRQTRTFLLEQRTGEVTLEASGPVRWLDVNAGSTGFYRVAYSPELLAALGKSLGALLPAERIGLLADQWALVRAGRARIADFLDLALAFGDESDHAVLDELMGRLGYIEARLVDGEDQERFRRLVERMFLGRFQAMGWDPVAGETDQDRLRRAALLRAVAGVARARSVLAETAPRVDRVLNGQRTALDPNLVDTAVAVTARDGDAELLDRLRAAFPREADPAVKRRYLLALTAFERPELATRAEGMLLDPVVPLQDFASFVHGLLANRVGREGSWKLLRDRWSAVVERTAQAPMLLRRVVEALGNLRERRHLDEARAFLEAHPVREAQQAVAQTLERLAQDVALRERLVPEVSVWLRGR
ncbi:MAG TPA: M1 family metallopeptidase [Myxococcaceae bacterium]|nr:M1 family metallopeptidase [Myxococcaceae bacterium]